MAADKETLHAQIEELVEKYFAQTGTRVDEIQIKWMPIRLIDSAVESVSIVTSSVNASRSFD